MAHHHPDDTNAAMIDINMLPVVPHRPSFSKARSLLSAPKHIPVRELEAIIAVTHIKQGSLP